MWKKVTYSFLRLNIARKLLLGYLPLSILIIFISVFALSNLEKLTRVSESIINADAPLIEAADRLIDAVIAQEFYVRRYVILKSPDVLELFWKRSVEFDNTIKQIRALPLEDIPFDSLLALHSEYNNIFIEGMEHLKKPSSELAKTYNSRIKDKQEELINLIKKISIDARQGQNNKILVATDIANKAFWVTAIAGGLGILFGMGAATLITRNISGSIRKLELATKEVSEGRFEYIRNIPDQDELGGLSHAFSEMTKRLKRLEEMYLDTSPLTRLPGNIAIENVLTKRLTVKTPLAFCLIDMDNFKAYNDRYGYARGSELIKATARIIEAAVAKEGTQEDFVGHIGGDDFVVISSPERYARICNAVIESFDKMVPDLYDPEDRSRGYIMGKTRQGQKMQFPIMTISIAVVTNKHRELENPAQVGELAAELKEYAKSIPGSLYVVDRRRKGIQQPEDEKVLKFSKEDDSDKKANDV